MPTCYVTAPRDAGSEIARTVVEERLAACVNELDCRSTYRWPADGDADAVHADDEVVLFVKTRDGVMDALVDRIEELHPYDVPCIEVFEADAVLEAYGEWIGDATKPPE